MAIHLELINYDLAFKQLKVEPIIINDMKFYSEVERAELISKFLTDILVIRYLHCLDVTVEN